MTAEAMTEKRATIVGALLVALGAISMSLYTPAMPALVTAFGTSVPTIKLSLTLYFAGFACAQLLVGPLADAFGRRPVALAFIGLYVVASVVTMLAPTVDWLLAGRLFQGIGASAGVAISRAIVRDRFAGQQSSRIMNAIGIAMAIGPAAAPTVGGLILASLGWQAIFAFLTLYGLLLLALILISVPETLSGRDPSRVHPRRLVASYAEIVRDPRFLQPAIIVGMTIGSLYASATMLPFVLIDRAGLTPIAFGIGMLAQSGSYIVGSLVTRLLMRRLDAARLVPFGIWIAAFGGLLLAILLRLGEPSYMAVMVPVAFIAFGISFSQPAATTGALAPFPHIAGSAAALLGFMQTGGGLLGSLAAALLHDPVVALATVVPAMMAMALAAQYGLGAVNARRARAALEAHVAAVEADRLAPGE